MAAFPQAIIAISLWLVAGCSQTPVGPGDKSLPASPPTYGAEAQRSAKLLSIWSSGLNKSASPGDEAVLCDIVLETLSEQFRKSNVATSEQIKALTAARKIYQKRASANFPSSDKLAAARQTSKATHPEMSDRLRIAMSCLRNLS